MSAGNTSGGGELAPLPRTFGRYLLLDALGQGGMSDVYLAKQVGMAGIERYCVVKIVATTRGAARHNIARFLDEARVVVHLSHQNICSVFDVGEVDGVLYLAMDYVAGQNINALLRERKTQGQPMALGLALFVLCELLKALDYAHRLTHPTTGQPLGIVHRDVSPENILVSYEGEVKLIDFGVAFSAIKEEKTRQGFVLGKLTYIAPEQARGQKAGIPADVFAAGVVGYELITGERYYGGLQQDFLTAVSTGDHVPRDWGKIEPDLGDILSRALRREPPTRYDSCSEFRKAIEQYQRDHDLTAGADELRDCLHLLFPEKPEETRKLLARFAAIAAPVPAPAPSAEPTVDAVPEPATLNLRRDDVLAAFAREPEAAEPSAVAQAFPAHDTDISNADAVPATTASRAEPTFLVHRDEAPDPAVALTGTEATVLIHMDTEPTPFEPAPLAPIEPAAPFVPPEPAPLLALNEPLPARRGPPTKDSFLAFQKRRAAKKLWLSVAAVGAVAVVAVAVLVLVTRDRSPEPEPRAVAVTVDAAVRIPATLGAAVGSPVDAATADAAEKVGVEFAGDEINDDNKTGRTGDRHSGRTRKPRPRDTGSKTGAATDAVRETSPAPTTMSETLELMKKCKRPCARQVRDKSEHLRDLDFEQVKKFPAELDRCVKACRR